MTNYVEDQKSMRNHAGDASRSIVSFQTFHHHQARIGEPWQSGSDSGVSWSTRIEFSISVNLSYILLLKFFHKHSLHGIKPRKKWHMEKGKCFQSWIIQSFGYYCELWNNYLLLIGFYRHLRVFKSVGKDRHVFKIPNGGKCEFWNHGNIEKCESSKAQLSYFKCWFKCFIITEVLAFDLFSEISN